MKSGEFANVLKGLAEMLGLAGAHVASDQLAALAKAFDAAPASSVSDAVKRLGQCPTSPMADDATLGELSRYLAPLAKVFALGGKAALVADFEAIQQLLQHCSSLTLGALVNYATTPPQRGPSGRTKLPPKAHGRARGCSRRLGRGVSSEAGGEPWQRRTVHDRLQSSEATTKPSKHPTPRHWPSNLRTYRRNPNPMRSSASWADIVLC